MNSESPEDQAAEVPQPTAEKLRAYVEANVARFTEAAMTAELIKAGYAAEDIRAAIADASRDLKPPPTGRAIWTILGAYAVTFAILSLGMLANTHRSSGCCMPNADAGILILAGSLGVALLLSLLWVGSRRATALLLAALLALAGLGSLSSGIVGFVLIGLAVALVVLVIRRPPKPSGRVTATLGGLIAVPMVLLVIVAGLCVATGLPIPGVG